MQLLTAITLVALAATVTSENFVHFDVEKRTRIDTGQHLQHRADASTVVTSVNQNQANLQEYIISVNIGSPSQRVGVTLDTGSSDLWVPSASFCQTKRCDFGSFDSSKSSTFDVVVANGFNITYAAPGDSDAGDWVSDSVSIGGAAAIQNQTFGLSNQGYDVHGVLGIGFDTHQAITPGGDSTYPAVIDNMFQNGLINRRAFSLYLNSLNQSRGSIVFGGIDSTKYSGDLVALPLQNAPGRGGVNAFYVTLSKVTFSDAAGQVSVLTPDDYAQSVLLDSGTSFTGVTNDLLGRMAGGMGAVQVGDSGYLTVPCQFNRTNATINYTFGGSDGVTISVPVSETIGLRYENECTFGFGSTLGGVSVFGDTFMRSAYVVFDIDNKVVAMAQAVDGRAATSSIAVIPTGSGLPGVSSTASGRGTQLAGNAAAQSPTITTASVHRSSIMPGTPTFNLGAAATSGVVTGAVSPVTSSSSAAAMPTVAVGRSQAALLGAGVVAGVLVW